MAFRVAQYGWRELIVVTAAAGAAMALLSWLFWPAMIVPAALWAWTVWFFRDPDRPVPAGPGLLVSPADGRVADVTNVGPESPLGCDGLRIGVFMNIFDVHVNRSPCQAVAEAVEHEKGAFLDARAADASTRNAAATIRLKYEQAGRTYPLVVRQVAGLLARRIVTDVRKCQQLCRGQRIGMIKFGSRLELLVPAELVGQVCVSVGQRVLAGVTVLVRTTGEDVGATGR